MAVALVFYGKLFKVVAQFSVLSLSVMLCDIMEVTSFTTHPIPKLDN